MTYRPVLSVMLPSGVNNVTLNLTSKSVALAGGGLDEKFSRFFFLPHLLALWNFPIVLPQTLNCFSIIHGIVWNCQERDCTNAVF